MFSRVSRFQLRAFRAVPSVLLPAVLSFSAACSTDRSIPARLEAPAPVAAQPSRQGVQKIVAFGDSLTAGYGLEPSEAYPAQLERMLAERGYQYEVVNAGVSGETSAGGVRQIQRVLKDDVALVVVCLGGNDGLRGLPVADLEKNIEAIIKAVKSRDVPVLLAGMEAPPQWGPEYTSEFRRVFAKIAQEQSVPLIPFLLEGVAGNPELNLEDGIHPNPRGAGIVASTVLAGAQPLLKKNAGT